MAAAAPNDSGRSKTLGMRKLKRRLTLLRPAPALERPKTRGECMPGGWNAERPCPFASCRHHLLLEVERNGAIKLNFGHDDPALLWQTCALDVAELEDGDTLAGVGRYLNVSRERARQLEERALFRLPIEAREALVVFFRGE